MKKEEVGIDVKIVLENMEKGNYSVGLDIGTTKQESSSSKSRLWTTSGTCTM